MPVPSDAPTQQTGGWQHRGPLVRLPGGSAPALARVAPADSAVDTLAGANAAAAATVSPGSDEPTHVHGASADQPIQHGRVTPPESVPLDPAAVLPFTFASPDAADTAAGAAGTTIQLLASDVLAIGLPMIVEPAPAPPAHVGASAAAPSEATARLEPRRVAWRDPESVPGTAVLAIGAATLVLATLAAAAVPEQDASLSGSGETPMAAGRAAIVPGALAG